MIPHEVGLVDLKFNFKSTRHVVYAAEFVLLGGISYTHLLGKNR
jgi:hypothetical protein